jgi:hypothetical protein
MFQFRPWRQPYPRDFGDGAARDDLAHEDYAAAQFTLHRPADIKAQVHFVEIRMQRDPQAAETGPLKTESHQAHIGLALEFV